MEIDYAQVRRAFRAETEEDLTTVEQALLVLEKAPSDHECVATVFRKFHTLKGNAAAVGLDRLSRLAHRVEDLFETLRSGKEPVTRGVITYLLQVIDVIRSLLPSAEAGKDEVSPAAEALLRRIEGGRLDESAAPAVAVADDAEHELGLATDATRTLRIDVGKLDSLLSVTSEIAIARGRLERLIEEQGTPGIADAYHAIERLLNAMHHSVSKVRMVPVGPLLRQYTRVVRDLSIEQRKEAELVIADHGVEVDNSLIEQLKAPLTHMVRNAVYHGLETPAVRQAKGKSPKGRIDLRARHEASDIVIEVADDGAGLDRAGILERARAIGIATEGVASERDVDRLIFSQGLSTARHVTSTSGRGVGMDVVLRHVDALGGSVEVASQPGRGTTFTIRMPLTLAMIEGLLVGVNQETFVIPMAGVFRCLDLSEAFAPQAADGVLVVRGRAVPFARLRALFALPGRPPEREVALVIQKGGDQVGLVFDRLLGRTQVVVKPPGRFFKGLPAVSGLTILRDGQVAPILNVTGLLQQQLQGRSASSEGGEAIEARA